MKNRATATRFVLAQGTRPCSGELKTMTHKEKKQLIFKNPSLEYCINWPMKRVENLV